jgi:hypothetical protein
MKRFHRKTNRRRKNQVKSQKKKIRKTRGGKVSRSFKGYRGGSDGDDAVAAAQAFRRARVKSSTDLATLKTYFNITDGGMSPYGIQHLRNIESLLHVKLSEISVMYEDSLDKDKAGVAGAARRASRRRDMIAVFLLESFEGPVPPSSYTEHELKNLTIYPLHSVQKEIVKHGEKPIPFSLRTRYVDDSVLFYTELSQGAAPGSRLDSFPIYIEKMQELGIITLQDDTTLSLASIAKMSVTVADRVKQGHNQQYVAPIIEEIMRILGIIERAIGLSQRENAEYRKGVLNDINNLVIEEYNKINE